METQKQVNPRNRYKKHSLEGGEGGGLVERVVAKLSQWTNVNTVVCTLSMCQKGTEKAGCRVPHDSDTSVFTQLGLGLALGLAVSSVQCAGRDSVKERQRFLPRAG